MGQIKYFAKFSQVFYLFSLIVYIDILAILQELSEIGTPGSSDFGVVPFSDVDCSWFGTISKQNKTGFILVI